MPNAIVTGASRGLGRALATALAERHYGLVIDARDAVALEEARQDLEERGARVVALPGSVTDSAHRRALVSSAWDLGGLDLLVNNAGILGPSPQPALADYPLDVLADVYLVNVLAPLGLIQDALPLLAAAMPSARHPGSPNRTAAASSGWPGATIVNVTSDAAVEPYEGWGGYGSAKAGLEQLTAILAAERPDVRILAIDPGDMRTRMHQEAFPGEDISDRPPPEASIPGLLDLLDSDRPSGRYRVSEIEVRA